MATLGACLTCVLLLAGTLHALDPNKHITQYMHTSWRIQDGSSPSGMYAITQTSDGFLWFLSSRGEIYRFDGVRFRPWIAPAEARSIGRIRNVVSDQAGGLWALGADGIAHVTNGVVTSHFELTGLEPNPLNVSEDTDGSIWVVRGDNGIAEPVCHVNDHVLKCYGKSDGIPIAPIDAILADGSGGFWLGGQAALVHWHAGTSETYPIKGLKPNIGAPGIMSLARGPGGSVWIGIFSQGPGLGLAKFEQGAVRSFVTPTFDGSKLIVFSLPLTATAIFGSAAPTRGSFEYAETPWSIMAERKASPAILSALCLKTARGWSGPQRTTGSTVSMIHTSPPSQPWRVWTRTMPWVSWPAKMAASG